MFKIITAIVLGVVLLVPIEGAQEKSPPKATEVTPEQFMAQVDKSNAALDKYAKLPCDNKDETVINDLVTQIGNLKIAYKNTPNGQDASIQLRETELFLGFLEVATSYTSSKNSICLGDKNKKDKDKDEHEPTPALHPHNLKS